MITWRPISGPIPSVATSATVKETTNGTTQSWVSTKSLKMVLTTSTRSTHLNSKTSSTVASIPIFVDEPKKKPQDKISEASKSKESSQYDPKKMFHKKDEVKK